MDANLERITPGLVSSLLLERHMARYAFAARFVEGLDVMDVACGTGYGSALLFESGAARVTGVDISEEAVDYARVHYGREGITFVSDDAERLGFDSGCFDAVVSFETLEHIEDCRAFLRESSRVLKPEGVFIVSTPNGRYDAKNPFHRSYLSLPEFETLLREVFPEVRPYGQLILGRAGRIKARISRLGGSLLTWQTKERLREALYRVTSRMGPKRMEPAEPTPETLASRYVTTDDIEHCKYFLAVCRTDGM